MLRCTACKSVLPEVVNKRCPHCRTSLRRNRPVVLSAQRIGPRFLSPLERARTRATVREEARAERAFKHTLRKRAASGETRIAPISYPGPAVYATETQPGSPVD